MSISELLDGRRICICVGAGGVGKTTTSATVALGMAARGLKVAVVTIDPARRLANALGLDQLDNEPRLIGPDELGDLDLRGELWAMMLDPKRTFDELIDRLAPDPERASEIKRNNIYRELSNAVSGSQEFTAVEKLYELAADDYDLVVLDTPPAHSAAEFLRAPGRLNAFLGGGALQALLRPSGLGMRLLGLGTAPLLSAVGRITGVDLLSDLTGFLALLGTMTEELDARARRVEALLHASDTAFLLVTSSEEHPVEDAIWLGRMLRASEMPLVGAVVNRVHPPLPRGEVALGLAPDLRAKLDATLADYCVLAARDATNLRRLREVMQTPAVILQVPELADDVHDLDGLLRIHGYLFA